MKAKARLTDIQVHPPLKTVNKTIEVNGKHGLYYRVIMVKNPNPVSSFCAKIEFSDAILYYGGIYRCNQAFQWVALDKKTLVTTSACVLLEHNFKLPERIVLVSKPYISESVNLYTPSLTAFTYVESATDRIIEFDFTL